MRIDSGGGAQRLIKISQDQIELVNSNLITATGALNTKIDTLPNKFKMGVFNNTSFARFSTTQTAPNTAYISGSQLLIQKKYSDTRLMVTVFINIGTDAGAAADTIIGILDYTTGQFPTVTLSGSPVTLRGSCTGQQDMMPYSVTFNLGTLPAGNVYFGLAIGKSVGSNIFVHNFSYVSFEALENA